MNYCALRYFNTVDLVNWLEEENRPREVDTLATQLSRLDLVVVDELGYLPFARSGGPHRQFSVQGSVLVSEMARAGGACGERPDEVIPPERPYS